MNSEYDNDTTNAVVDSAPLHSISSHVRPSSRNRDQQSNPLDDRTSPTCRSTYTSVDANNVSSDLLSTNIILVPVSEVSVLPNRDRITVVEGHLLPHATPEAGITFEAQAEPTYCGIFTKVLLRSVLFILFLALTILTVFLVLKLKKKLVAKIRDVPSTSFSSLMPSQSVYPSASSATVSYVSSSRVPSKTFAPSYPPSLALELVQLRSNIYGFAAEEYVGKYVAITNEGNRIFVGGLGVFRVYEYKSEGSWSLEKDLSSYTPEGSCFSISVSLDGDNILLGIPNYGGQRRGAAMVLREDNDKWVRRSIVRGDQGFGYFGTTVAITRDGTTIVVGSSHCLQLFQWSNDEFVLAKKLEFNQNDFEMSLSVAPDGSLMAVGNYFKNEVYLYTLPSMTLFQRIVSGKNLDHFVANVLVSDDKSCIAIASGIISGSSLRDDRVEIFRADLATALYRKSEVILSSEIASFSVCCQCKRLVIGVAFNRNCKGKTNVFVFQHNGWSQVSEMHGDADNDHFGSSVALSVNGDYAAVGVPRYDKGEREIGQVKVFKFTGGHI